MFASLRNLFVGTLVVVLAILGIAIYSSAYADAYTYDTLGRLTRVDYSNGSCIIYAYDDAGNRVTVTQKASGC